MSTFPSIPGPAQAPWFVGSWLGRCLPGLYNLSSTKTQREAAQRPEPEDPQS